MKSSIAAALILLLGAVSALPASDLEKRDDPSLSPVNLIHMPTEGFTCGKSCEIRNMQSIRRIALLNTTLKTYFLPPPPS